MTLAVAPPLALSLSLLVAAQGRVTPGGDGAALLQRRMLAESERAHAEASTPWVPSPADAGVRMRVMFLPSSSITIVQLLARDRPSLELVTPEALTAGPGRIAWSVDGSVALVLGPAKWRTLANGDAVLWFYEPARQQHRIRGAASRTFLEERAALFDPPLTFAPLDPGGLMMRTQERVRRRVSELDFDGAVAVIDATDADLASRSSPLAGAGADDAAAFGDISLARARDWSTRMRAAVAARRAAWSRVDVDPLPAARLAYDWGLGRPDPRERERLLPHLLLRVPAIAERAQRRFPMRLIVHDEGAGAAARASLAQDAVEIGRRTSALGIPVVAGAAAAAGRSARFRLELGVAPKFAAVIMTPGGREAAFLRRIEDQDAPVDDDYGDRVDAVMRMIIDELIAAPVGVDAGGAVRPCPSTKQQSARACDE